MNQYRTHTCGELKSEQVDQDVFLQGWVDTRRDHGGVIFIDLRDRYGLTQIVFRPEIFPDSHKAAQDIRPEFVIQVHGKVEKRPDGRVNKNLSTGEIDVIVSDVKVLSSAKTPPFLLDDEAEVTDTLRLKYRYLDLRRSSLKKNFIIRHKMNQAVRNQLNDRDFLEVETPVLTRSTPEGARDYLVPSRVHPGKFYALPQSPQIFKQILMISGFDRYYQIVRCFRDEDLRSDRQPEFTQLDIEMSFVTPELLFKEVESLMKVVFLEVLGVEIQTPFQRMAYKDVMEKYASDKPDLRWPIELRNLSECLTNTEFRVFKSVLDTQGEVRGFRLPKGNALSRNQIDQLVDKAKGYGAKGLVWMRKAKGVVTCSVEKFLSKEEMESVAQKLGLEDEDLGLVIADRTAIARAALNSIRLDCLQKLEIPPVQKHAFLWVTDFPLFDFSEEEQRFVSTHHPFTSPHPDDEDLLRKGKDLGKVRAQAYDLVLNGCEIGGGSIRIHDSSLQAAVFRNLGMSQEEATQKFGFFLEALQYGTPPHGGIAFGLDRIAMLLCETLAIRDVIAFPKTQSALDLMSEAPSHVARKQLEELHIRLHRPAKG